MSPVFRLLLAALALAAAVSVPAWGASGVREIVWTDVVPQVQELLRQRGVDRATFPAHISELRRRNQARMREGDLDHLIYYALQSSAHTDLPPIEPAVSAAELVGRLNDADRSRFLAGADPPGASIPSAVQARLTAFAAAVEGRARESRLGYFRELLVRERAGGVSARDFLFAQYIRAMRFLYEKEFVAARQADRTTAIGTLYQARGLSTDTSVEAGYVVYLALATLGRLEPQRRIRRVLIVGPGLDLAPRTDLVDASEAQSYQPFAVMDALLTLGFAGRDELRVTAVDINPRVIDWLEHARETRTRLTLVSAVAETNRVRFAADFRSYFEALGSSIAGSPIPPSPVASGFPPLPKAPAGLAEARVAREGGSRAVSGRLLKSIDVDPRATSALDATRLDVVVDRLDRRFDLIVVTNVFPYLSDVDLLLALTNMAAMLAPGGTLLHNEPRPMLAEVTSALRLALIHSRSAVIATVEGAESPLYDAVWMHRAPE